MTTIYDNLPSWDTDPTAEDTGFSDIPKGKYQCVIDAVEPKENRDGTGRIELTLVVLNGDYEGRKVWMKYFLSEKGRPIFKRDLIKLGVNGLKTWSELPQHFERLLDKVIEISVSYRFDDKGVERQNVFLNKVLDIPAPDRSGDIPF